MIAVGRDLHLLLFAKQVEDLRRRMVARGDQLFTSALTVGEVLVGALAGPEQQLYARYEAFFRRPDISVIPFDPRAASAYARIRRDRGIQRPDAIQLACAAAAEVDLFITNDARLSRKIVPGIHFIASLSEAPV